MSKERPIIMTGESVRAILDGRKTQTRRVVKPQPTGANYWTVYYDFELRDTFYPNKCNSIPVVLHCPYGEPGDLLWVKESYATDIPGCPNGITYRADHIDPQGDGPANPIKWKSSLFMPRRASRLTVVILNVRVERIQEINENDCIAEGIEPMFDGGVLFGYRDYSEYETFTLGGGRSHEMRSAERLSYRSLWDTLNARRGHPWADNPRVWVIDFKVLP